MHDREGAEGGWRAGTSVRYEGTEHDTKTRRSRVESNASLNGDAQSECI